jgi:hypothetical protein
MLIEITLPQTALDKAILLFDGRILEVFHTLWEGKTHRYHAATLASVQIVTDKHGAHSLTLKAKAGYHEQITVEPADLARAQKLVDEVQRAIMENL